MQCGWLIPIFISAYFLNHVEGGCGGYRDLPLQMGKPSTKITSGKKNFLEKDIKSLANSIRREIKGLSTEYATEVAENALGTEADFETTFIFCMETNRATLTQYEITTAKKDKVLSISWRIAEAAVKFTALREFVVNARRRRKIWSGRRRCANERRPRGVTKVEIAKIRNTLNTAVNPAKRRLSTTRRYRSRIGSERQCPAKITRPIKPPFPLPPWMQG